MYQLFKNVLTNVLKACLPVRQGQLNSAQLHRLGEQKIIELCGLKAQLNLPFQGAFNIPKLTQGDIRLLGGLCLWAELIRGFQPVKKS
jgi:hypothetical protein